MDVDDEVLAVARDRVRREARAVASVADQMTSAIADVARLVVDCPGKLFIAGSGTSGTIARRMAQILSVTGTPAVFLSPMDALHGMLGAVTSKDVVLLVSNGGASSEINELAARAGERGTRVVALTGAPASELAAKADICAVVQVADGADIGDTIATGVTLAQAAWGDALAEILMRARGYSWESMLFTHPAGAVGKLPAPPQPLAPLRLTSATKGATSW